MKAGAAMASFEFNIEKLMAGNIAQLRLEREFFSSLTSHRGEIGRLNETHLVRMLRRYLPPKFGIGTGFIVSGGETADQSAQCDIIIYDAINNAPFYYSEAWQVYPVEMVYGVIEVKTRIDTTELIDAFEKCARIRALCRTPEGKPNKRYLRPVTPKPKQPAEHQSYASGVPPRFFVFGYEGPSAESLSGTFADLTQTMDGAHIHGICVLDEGSGLFLQHLAYRAAQDRVSPISANGFWRFLMEMPLALNSLVPGRPLKLDVDTMTASWGEAQAGSAEVGSGIFFYRPQVFDAVDLEHYNRARGDSC